MGRSGGGHRSGGGGGGHSHSYHSSSSYHHHHYHSGGYYSSSSGECSPLSCCISLVVVGIFVAVVIIFSVLLEDTEYGISTTLSECEQIIVCPESLQNNKVTFKNQAGSDVIAYLTNSTPPISKDFSQTIINAPGQSVSSYDYVYRSFNLVAGSVLYWNITGSRTFVFYLLKGEKNFDKFKDDESFDYVQHIYTSYTNKSYKAPTSGEYFVVIEAYSDVFIDDATYTVEHLRYQVEKNTIKKCTHSCDFDVDLDKYPHACVVAELACGASEDNADASLSYKEAHGIAFYVCLAIVAGIGVCVVGSIVGCICCCVCGKVKRGATLGTLNASDPLISSQPSAAVATPTYQTTAVATPSYQTTPSAPSATLAPSYQPTPTAPPTSAYNPAPPSYASADPSAPPYVPFQSLYGVSQNP